MKNNSQIRTKRDITNAFLELLKSRTFQSITINDICEKAMVHRSTFYRYYKDKYDLLEHVTSIIAQNFYQHATLNRDSNRSFFEDLLDYVEDNRHIFLNITIKNSSNNIYNELINLGSKILLENAKMMEDPISKKIRHFEHAKLACDFYSSGFINLLKNWIENEYQISKDEITNMFTLLL